jgi:superfamily I DNA/RNA helicase
VPLLRSMDWWEEEVDWIKGRTIAEWEGYRTVERSGRGQGLREHARRMVWEVVCAYNQLLRSRGLCDFRDYSLRLLALGTPLPDRWRVEHVLIDEAQDLHYADLQVLTHLARVSTTVVADRTQKIYQTGFTWRDLGFDISGGNRSRVLSQSYRTTRQIAQLAASLQQHETLVRPGDPDYSPGTPPHPQRPAASRLPGARPLPRSWHTRAAPAAPQHLYTWKHDRAARAQ